ncbi:unnamed protein product [Pieris macdunnoughi]|uniref:Uncharacterized protein n=1 Tax=Pieris macdunnoughi TaxID=345717 RepID=A0A821QZV4_9NEOP|nr:unnamed protein product [Pieris macdunnoughi]
MGLVSTLKVFFILANILTICANGDTGNIPLDMQTLSRDNERQASMYPNTIYYPNMYTNYPQEWTQARAAPETESKWNFQESLSDEEKSRSASKFAPLTYSKPLYKPNLPWSANIYHGPNLEADLIKPKFGLLEPSLKLNKLGSLLNFGLALLGGSGFKDTLINNILRPLLASKGALKTFIGKLSIPVVALILVNVEVLFVVWWLWEDCTEQTLDTVTPFSSQATVSNFSTSKQVQ